MVRFSICTVVTRRFVDEFGEVTVFVGVCTVIVVIADVETSKIALVFIADAGDEFFMAQFPVFVHGA